MRVKLLDIKVDGKLSFSIKDADEGRAELKGSVKKTFEAKFDELGRRIGPITGILLDDTHTRITKKHQLKRADREPSPDLWEKKQLKGGQVLHMVEN